MSDTMITGVSSFLGVLAAAPAAAPPAAGQPAAAAPAAAAAAPAANAAAPAVAPPKGHNEPDPAEKVSKMLGFQPEHFRWIEVFMLLFMGLGVSAVAARSKTISHSFLYACVLVISCVAFEFGGVIGEATMENLIFKNLGLESIFCLLGVMTIAFFFVCVRWEFVLDVLVVCQTVVTFGIAFLYPTLCWVLGLIASSHAVVTAHVFFRITGAVFFPLCFILVMRNRISKLFPHMTIIFSATLLSMSFGLALGLLFLKKFPGENVHACRILTLWDELMVYPAGENSQVLLWVLRGITLGSACALTWLRYYIATKTVANSDFSSERHRMTAWDSILKYDEVLDDESGDEYLSDSTNSSVHVIAEQGRIRRGGNMDSTAPVSYSLVNVRHGGADHGPTASTSRRGSASSLASGRVSGRAGASARNHQDVFSLTVDQRNEAAYLAKKGGNNGGGSSNASTTGESSTGAGPAGRASARRSSASSVEQNVIMEGLMDEVPAPSTNKKIKSSRGKNNRSSMHGRNANNYGTAKRSAHQPEEITSEEDVVEE